MITDTENMRSEKKLYLINSCGYRVMDIVALGTIVMEVRTETEMVTSIKNERIATDIIKSEYLDLLYRFTNKKLFVGKDQPLQKSRRKRKPSILTCRRMRDYLIEVIFQTVFLVLNISSFQFLIQTTNRVKTTKF